MSNRAVKNPGDEHDPFRLRHREGKRHTQDHPVSGRARNRTQGFPPLDCCHFHCQINICPEPFRGYTEYNLWRPPYPKAMGVDLCSPFLPSPLGFPAAQWLQGTEPKLQSGILILTSSQTGRLVGGRAGATPTLDLTLCFFPQSLSTP